MTQSENESLRCALSAFRTAIEGLSEHSAHGQIVALNCELLRACVRAAESQERSLTLERRLDAARADAEVRAFEQQAMAERSMRERDAMKSDYEERLRVLRSAHADMRDRCASLEELCRSLLITLEQAACAHCGAESQAERSNGSP